MRNINFKLMLAISTALCAAGCGSGDMNSNSRASNANAAPTPRTATTTRTPVTTPATPHTEHVQADDDAPRISIAEARAAAEAGKAVFVDVRPLDDYKQNHIKGALSIPLPEVTARAGELPADKLIITYCA